MKKEFHILVTGTGRRVELIQAFREAALTLDVSLKIYGADMAGDAPALAYCNYTRKVCRMRDENYIPQLLDICRKDKIDLLVPTIDTDLLVLSKNRDAFLAEGTQVLISSPEMIAVCRDKNFTADFFRSCGVNAPETVNDYRAYSGTYPCFIKPKDGSSSIDAYKVNHPSELKVYAGKIGEYIIQPFIDGTEYTIDVFCDFDGNPIYVVPRERVAVRSGEVLKTKIFMDETMIQEALRIIEKFRPCGPMTVQLIRQKETSDDYFIEINPRFGGGSPLSMKAGARSAEAILRLLNGEKVEYKSCGISDGAVFSRFDQCVCIDDGELIQPLRGVIFDLDDTLYSEKEYVKCGFEAIAERAGKPEYAEKLWSYFLEGKPAVDELIKETGAEDKKAEYLEAYRNNKPNLQLYGGAEEFLLKLREKGVKVGIITDGRPEGQRNKIEALGLEALVDDIIITDELGGAQFRKPNDIAFRIMQCRWKLPFEQIAYVGDNPHKDFSAPKQLGMKSVHFKNSDGLYFEDGAVKMSFDTLSDVFGYISENTD